MAVTFEEDRSFYDAILDEVQKLDGSYVLVGFQEGEVTHAETKNGRDKKAGLSLPQIAAQNEFGTDHIPARSFMRTSYDENKKKIEIATNSEYEKIIDGTSTVKRSLGLIGKLMEQMIRNKIRSIHYPPNSPRTIAIKKSSKPLIDFGQMISAVHSKVVIR